MTFRHLDYHEQGASLSRTTVLEKSTPLCYKVYPYTPTRDPYIKLHIFGLLKQKSFKMIFLFEQQRYTQFVSCWYDLYIEQTSNSRRKRVEKLVQSCISAKASRSEKEWAQNSTRHCHVMWCEESIQHPLTPMDVRNPGSVIEFT